MDTTVHDPLVGRVLDGRYQVGQRLAYGGMATVYRGVDLRLDRVVALKVMHPALAADPDFVARFIREAKSAARLSHPAVVSVYDQGADHGVVFLAMEYVEGGTLRDLLRERGGRLSVEDTLAILDPVLAALAAAHRADIAHRDIKPENVLIGVDGRIKVADFGLARAMSSTTAVTSASGLFFGTVAYLAPEQVERGISDARSDVYAAGILAYEMLTGRKPFEGENVFHVMNQRVYDEVPPPSRLVAGLPPAVDRFVALATARDPQQRPADAGQLAVELARTRASLELKPSVGAVGTTSTSATGTDATGTDATGTNATGNTTSGYGTASDGSALPDRTAQLPHGTDSPPAPSPPAPRRRKRHRGLVALLVILLLAAGLSAAAWWAGAGPGAYTTTPSVLGLTSQQAERKLTTAGLSWSYTPARYSETVPAGQVLAMLPRPGAEIRKDGTVQLTLSRGKERYAVPNLTGLARAQAQKALTARHLTLGEVTERYDMTTPPGRVVAQTPEPSAEVKRDTAVSIVLSKGPPPVEVPAVIGEPLEDAQATLAEAGLESTVVGEEFSDTVDKGRVLAADPDSGTIPRGSTVELVVSKGPDLVEVPDVVGDPVDKAIQELEKAGFDVRLIRAPFGPGTVYDQSPTGTVKRGSTVTLYVV